MDMWLAVAVFPQITYKGLEDRMRHEVTLELSVGVRDESLSSRKTEVRDLTFFGEISLRGTWRKLTGQWLHSKNLGK